MRANGKGLLSRLKNMNRDDLEIYGLTLAIYVWCLVFIPDIWLRDPTGQMYALPRMSWVIIFLLTTDFIYCYWEYGLILDLRRDFNFYASMSIIALIAGFFVMLIWFW